MAIEDPEAAPEFSRSDVDRFAARRADVHVLLLVPLELQCSGCKRFFPTKALASAPVGYSENELRPITSFEVADRRCLACREAEL